MAESLADPGAIHGLRHATEEDYARVISSLLADRPASGEIWVFAYGSLIWKPVCEVVDRRVALLHGWHRSFCLGWDNQFRGTPARPGLMLVLDRGGACRGVAERLPPAAVEDNLIRLFKREMFLLPSPMPPRWVTVRPGDGTPLRAITFTVDRHAGRYVGGLTDGAVADMLANAAGQWGSMAEYLYNTVVHLEAEGIHDRRLWRYQEMVAARIEKSHGLDI